MNPIVKLVDGKPVTSSRDVAELFGKQHGHVLRDIEKLLPTCPSNFGETSQEVEMPNGGARSDRMFLMDRDGFSLLAMGFTGQKALQWKIRYIEAFNAMEKQLSAPMDPTAMLNDPVALRNLLIGQTEKRLELEATISTLKTEVVGFERIAKANGSVSITEAAKALQVRPADLFRWLQAHGWIYKRHGGANWLGYQSKTQAGYLEHKVETILRSDGTDKLVEQVRITPKGITKLAQAMSVAA